MHHEPRRLLTVIESLGGGGAEHGSLTLLPQLARNGYRCEVAVLGPPYDLADAYRQAGLRVHALGLRHRSQLPRACVRLAAISRRFAPSVVHSHLFLAGLCSALSRPLDPAPLRVSTFHNLGYASYPVASISGHARRVLDRLTMTFGMDGWIAVSEAVRAHYAAELGLSAIRTIPNGIDLDEIRSVESLEIPDLRRRWGIEHNRSVLVCAGRFRHEKGHRHLLAALTDLAAGASRPTLLLAGDGPLRGEIVTEVARRGLQHDVRLLGHLPHRDLLTVILCADAVVMPSTHEGLPMVAVEALALGTPVVASGVGGLPELIDNERTGLLVRAGDIAELSYAIERVLTDQALASRLGAAAKAVVRSRYDAARIAEAHKELFDELSARRRSTVER